MRLRRGHIFMAAVVSSLAFICAAGCSPKPSDVLSDDEMRSLMKDMYKAGALISIDARFAMNDTARSTLRASVLASHNVSEESFNTALDWYGHHIDDYHEIFENVEADLRKESQEKGAMASSSAGLWSNPSRLYLSPSAGTDLLSFELSQSEIKQGVSLEWDAVAKNIGGGFTAIMCVEYTDGTHEYRRQQFRTPGTVHLTIPLNSTKRASRAFGYATLNTSVIAPVVLDSISLAFSGH